MYPVYIFSTKKFLIAFSQISRFSRIIYICCRNFRKRPKSKILIEAKVGNFFRKSKIFKKFSKIFAKKSKILRKIEKIENHWFFIDFWDFRDFRFSRFFTEKKSGFFWKAKIFVGLFHIVEKKCFYWKILQKFRHEKVFLPMSGQCF